MGVVSSFDFQLKTRIVFGLGRLCELGDIVGKIGRRALLVSYAEPGGLEEALGQAERALQDAGVAVEKFLEVQPDPVVETAEEGARIARGNGVEVVVGIGGGSAMDVAKGISLLAQNEGKVWDYFMCNPDRREPAGVLPKVLIPTTAGTGSETSFAAVLTDPSHGVKATIVTPMNAADIAVIDPELTLALPQSLTATCGADALGHCLECFISRAQTPLGRLFSWEGARLIAEGLPRAVKDGSDLEARADMALAAMYGGLGLAYSGAIGTHAMAHAMGALLRVPHGLCIALIEPHIMRFSLKECGRECARLAALFGVGGREDERASKFPGRLLEFLSEIGIPSRITVKPEQKTDVFARKVAENAQFSTPKSVEHTPGRLTIEDMAAIYLKIVR